MENTTKFIIQDGSSEVETKAYATLPATESPKNSKFGEIFELKYKLEKVKKKIAKIQEKISSIESVRESWRQKQNAIKSEMIKVKDLVSAEKYQEIKGQGKEEIGEIAKKIKKTEGGIEKYQAKLSKQQEKLEKLLPLHDDKLSELAEKYISEKDFKSFLDLAFIYSEDYKDDLQLLAKMQNAIADANSDTEMLLALVEGGYFVTAHAVVNLGVSITSVHELCFMLDKNLLRYKLEEEFPQDLSGSSGLYGGVDCVILAGDIVAE